MMEEKNKPDVQQVAADIQKAVRHAQDRIETHAQDFIVPSVKALHAWSKGMPGSDCDAEKFYKCVVS